MNHKTNYENTFILDKMDTWPVELSYYLQVNKEILRNYFTRKIEIERLQVENPIYRYNIIENLYKNKYEEMIEKIDLILNEYNILGFHCSNLIDYEQKDILKNGLSPLSKKVIDKKLEVALKQGFLSSDLYLYLKTNNLAEVSGRTNFVFCFYTLNKLKEDHGLDKILTIWGGESIHWNEDSEETIRKLSWIGEPSIVVVKIQYKDVCHFHNLSEKIIDKYFSIIDNNHYFTDIDDYFDYKLDVVEIISYRDERFEKLTNFSKWEKYE